MLVLPLALLQTLWGLGLMALFCSSVLPRMTLSERLGVGVLVGVITQSYIHLFVMLVLTHDFYASYVALLACAAIPFAFLGSVRRWISPGGARTESPRLFANGAIRCLAGVGVLGLLSWVVAAAIFLPTTDYDALTIWSYRDKVLLTEHTLFTPSLMDPLRFNPMPHHPYMIPIMETSYAMAAGAFRYWAIHVPYVLFYLGFLGLAFGAGKAAGSSWRGGAIAASLALMPAMAVQPLMNSGREPYMAIMAFGAVYYAGRWLEEPEGAWLALSVCFAAALHQTKIEGTPFIAGYAMGILLFCALTKGEFQIRKKQIGWAVLAFVVIMVPWNHVSGSIPKSNHEYGFTNGILSNVHPLGVVMAVPYVLYLMISEFMFRPELFGVAPLAIVAGVTGGWRRENAPARLALLAGPAALLLTLLGLYAVRQTQLDVMKDNNALLSLSRRILVVGPALVYACLYLPWKRTPASLTPSLGFKSAADGL